MVPLAGLWAVVGGRCSVLVDAVWLCMTRALLRPVLTCVAAYCVPPGDMYGCDVPFGELQNCGSNDPINPH